MRVTNPDVAHFAYQVAVSYRQTADAHLSQTTYTYLSYFSDDHDAARDAAIADTRNDACDNRAGGDVVAAWHVAEWEVSP